MARFKNYKELIEEIQSLPQEKQEHLLLFIKHKIKDEPIFPERNKPTSLKIELQMFEKVPRSEYEKLSETAKYSAFYTEALFWFIEEFSSMAWQGNDIKDQQDLFQNLSFISKIGVSLASNTADYIDRAEMIYDLEVSKNREGETNAKS